MPVAAIVWRALWLVLGALWCGAVLRRLPRDLRDWREDPEERPAQALVWGVSALVALGWLRTAWGVLAGLAAPL